MNWKEHRVFVTGATGFIGSWLVRYLLEQGAYVVVLIRDWDPQSQLIRSGDVQRTRVVNGPLEDYAVLERAINEHGTDTVFHLGAQTLVGTALRSPLSTFESNIRGTYNLLEACRVHSGIVQRVVVASSDKAYGEVEQLPYREDTPLQARNPYDVSKSCPDMIAISYASSYGLPVGITRCGNVYGGGDLNWSQLVPGVIRSILAAAALLAAIAATPAARAATPTTTDEARSWGQLAKMKPMDVMHMIDTDKKGYVTREEFLKFQEQLFDKMDKDHDGKVMGSEWMGKAATGTAKK